MKSPIDIIKGKIIDVTPEGKMVIEAYYDDYLTLIRREYKECNIQLLDSRPLSQKQRNCCYAMLHDIADFTGMGVDSTKEYMKLKFLAEELQQTAEQIFSLSNAPMSLVCGFQRFLARFMLDWEIPSKRPLIEYVDDIDDYVYQCLLRKKCAICGAHADIHHCEGSRVGMGGDRTEMVHEGLEVLPLCRLHHSEVHTKPEREFMELYHINHGVIADKAICKVYKLKTEKN